MGARPMVQGSPPTRIKIRTMSESDEMEIADEAHGIARDVRTDAPSLDELNSCLKVLGWMRDGDVGLHESWTAALTHVRVAVRVIRNLSYPPNDKVRHGGPDE